MHILSIVHQADAGAGVFGEVAAGGGHELDEWNPVEGKAAPDLGGYDAAFTFGGSMNVTDDQPSLDLERRVLEELLGRDTPLLAVCLGAELLAEAAGGSVHRIDPEIGWLEVDLTEAAVADPVIGALPSSFDAFQWHSYGFDPPPGATELARSPACSQAFRIGRAWAIQFHAEVARPDAEHWIDDYRSDPDAVAIGLDPQALRAETQELIGDWNGLGRALCERFLEAATPA
jgi:GMP synthase-like glutamine amidotransferase